MIDYEQKKVELDEKINGLQDRYFSMLKDMVNGDDSRIDELKEVQKEVIIFTDIHRETSLEIAKQALEEAFTPRLKKMLAEKIMEEKNEEE
tara:strand:+ start:762 stop:1034 length:273 start_codon:yes stop_codon:yes gene_type:complete